MLGAQLALAQMRQSRRRTRSPRHTWYVNCRPWQVQPFMIAPVLPGETLKNLTFQARTVSAPIQNSVIGWHNEYMFFYVKLRDLYARDIITNMILKPETDISSLDNATAAQYYHLNGTETAINWTLRCVEVIVDNYFRSEGEVAGDYTLNNMYTASIGQESWIDSIINEDSIVQASGVDQNLVSTSAGQGDATTGVWTSEIEKAMKEYEYARMMKTTDMTFEDWCETFGVQLQTKEELYKPELIRYVRDWTFPTNTVDPTNGTPRSAVSWSTSGQANKQRLFKEPGFIVGVTVKRPKVYLTGIRSAAVMMMKNAYAWLPPQLASDPWASFQKLTAGDPPLDINTDGWYADIKDLFLYGDQFTTEDMSSVTGINQVALPNAAMSNKRYPASTDADNLFVDTTAGVGKVREDGVCMLHILGRQVDTSPSNVGTNKTV